MSLRSRIAALRLDLTPARESRDFRLLLIAGSVFYLGHMVSYVALPFLIYRETGSNAMVGVMGAVQLVPLVVFGLWGTTVLAVGVQPLSQWQIMLISVVSATTRASRSFLSLARC